MSGQRETKGHFQLKGIQTKGTYLSFIRDLTLFDRIAGSIEPHLVRKIEELLPSPPLLSLGCVPLC